MNQNKDITLCHIINCTNTHIPHGKYCQIHKSKPSKRCVETGCKKSARGGSDKCKGHGGGKRCPNCIDWLDSRSGSLKYDGYCATCFKRVFPTDPRSTKIYEHTKEILVRNAITKTSLTNELFKSFVHDITMYTGNCDCTHRRRVDHRKLI